MPNYVYLKIPREAWALLEETLQKDCRSWAFDRELRESIKTALAEVEDATQFVESALTSVGER